MQRYKRPTNEAKQKCDHAVQLKQRDCLGARIVLVDAGRLHLQAASEKRSDVLSVNPVSAAPIVLQRQLQAARYAIRIGAQSVPHRELLRSNQLQKNPAL